MTGKRKSLLTAGIIAAFGLAIMTSSTVLAQTPSDESGVDSIVQKIAQKFNLKESDVRAVFEAERQDRMAKMKENQEARLSKLVSEGKITEAQKKLIKVKQAELQKNMQADLEKFKNMTDEERKAAMEKRKTELDSWAKEIGIDPQYLMFFVYKGGGPHMGMKFKMKMGN